MKRAAAVVGFALLCLYGTAWAAEQQISFSGTWILDSKNSDPFPHPVAGLSGYGVDMSGGDIAGGGGMGGGMRGGPQGDMGAGVPGGGMGRGMPGFGGRGPQTPTENFPLVIQQTDTEIQFSRIVKVNGADTTVLDKYKFDGSENVSMMRIPNLPDPVKTSTKATLKKNRFVIHMTTFYPQGKGETTRELTLSKDGKTLTQTTQNNNARGQQFVQKQVYHKQ